MPQSAMSVGMTKLNSMTSMPSSIQPRNVPASVDFSAAPSPRPPPSASFKLSPPLSAVRPGPHVTIADGEYGTRRIPEGACFHALTDRVTATVAMTT